MVVSRRLLKRLGKSVWRFDLKGVTFDIVFMSVMGVGHNAEWREMISQIISRLNLLRMHA